MPGQTLALTGSSSTIDLRPLPQDDPARRRPDITLARELLGWSPTTALADGLPRTVAYFTEVLAGEENPAAVGA